MRAKMKVINVEPHATGQEILSLVGVAKDGAYPSDGSDEENSFAKFSPSVNLDITIANPALVGMYPKGTTFYVDFTPLNKHGHPIGEPDNNERPNANRAVSSATAPASGTSIVDTTPQPGVPEYNKIKDQQEVLEIERQRADTGEGVNATAERGDEPTYTGVPTPDTLRVNMDVVTDDSGTKATEAKAKDKQ